MQGNNHSVSQAANWVQTYAVVKANFAAFHSDQALTKPLMTTRLYQCAMAKGMKPAYMSMCLDQVGIPCIQRRYTHCVLGVVLQDLLVL
jgi:hypothetical protein